MEIIICAVCGATRSLSAGKAKKTSTCGNAECKRIFRNSPERRAIRSATMRRLWASPETCKILTESNRGPRIGRRSKLFGLGKPWLEEQYLVKKLSMQTIADSIGVTCSNVVTWARRWDIPARRTPNRHKSNGYVLVKMPEHPKAQARGFIFEHIIVWEQATGKAVPDGWQVHHLNGIKDDNAPENLVALPKKVHHLVLKAQGERIRALEAQVRSLKSKYQLKLI